MIYGYGIDLAQTLNYCAIIVGACDYNTVHLAAIRKVKDLMYPNIRKILVKELFPQMPPTFAVVDYTSEKAFSEELETELNPLFRNMNTPYYGKWQYVQPFIFSQGSKLGLWQNTRRFLENGWFKFPATDNPNLSGETIALINELQEQLMRVSAVPTQGEIGIKFPKPTGHNDDLAIACGLMLDGMKDYVGGASMTQAGISVIHSVDFDTPSPYSIPFNSITQARLDSMMGSLKGLGSNRNIKLKSAKEKDWWQK